MATIRISQVSFMLEVLTDDKGEIPHKHTVRINFGNKAVPGPRHNAVEGTVTECLTAIDEQLPIAIADVLKESLKLAEEEAQRSKAAVETQKSLLTQLNG